MKVLNHPNIVNLIEVIDDPTMDHFYMGTPFSSMTFSLLPILPKEILAFHDGRKPLYLGFCFMVFEKNINGGFFFDKLCTLKLLISS